MPGELAKRRKVAEPRRRSSVACRNYRGLVDINSTQ